MPTKYVTVTGTDPMNFASYPYATPLSNLTLWDYNLCSRVDSFLSLSSLRKPEPEEVKLDFSPCLLPG